MRRKRLLGWYLLLILLCSEVVAYSVAGWVADCCRNLFQRQFNAAMAVDQEVDKVPYADVINRVAKGEGISARLVASVIEAESSFQPKAVSPTGAVGLMQILPSTWQEVNSRLKICANSPEYYYDPEVNIQIGTAYLIQMINRYQGNTMLALAAYTAGPGAVDRCGGIPPDTETEEYVERVMVNWYHFAAVPLPESGLMARQWAQGRRVLGWGLAATACLTLWMTRRKRYNRSWRWR